MEAAAAAPVSMTSAWSSVAGERPAAQLVRQEKAVTFIPKARAWRASSTVLMPTASAPIVRSMRISAGVSYCGPRSPA